MKRRAEQRGHENMKLQRASRWILAPGLVALALLPPLAAQEGGAAGEAEARAALVRALAEKGVFLDLDRGLIELRGRICQRYEPLEYLLVVARRGKDHESLFKVDQDVSAEALNTAMLLTGVEKGENGRLLPRDPPPTAEEMDAGVRPYTVQPARGDGFYIYAAWERELPGGGKESFFFRAEDLVLHVRAERTYQRGRWVYLGSRFIRAHKDAPELYAAEAEGNLVSLVYFNPANHILTGADPEADNQYVWYPNLYLIPELDHPVRILFSREPLETPPPRVAPAAGG